MAAKCVHSLPICSSSATSHSVVIIHNCVVYAEMQVENGEVF